MYLQIRAKNLFFVAILALCAKKRLLSQCSNYAPDERIERIFCVSQKPANFCHPEGSNGRFQLNRVEIQIRKPTIQTYVILCFLKTKSKFQTLFRFSIQFFYGSLPLSSWITFYFLLNIKQNANAHVIFCPNSNIFLSVVLCHPSNCGHRATNSF